MSIPTNFAGHPVSIAERRADKTGRGSSWSPRDALVAMLREIDEGHIDTDALVVCYRLPGDSPGEYKTRFSASTPDGYVTLALLEAAKFRVMDLK